MLKDISRKEQRYDAVTMVMRDGFSITDVAAKFNVSRQTVYRCLASYQVGGLGAVADGSHRPSGPFTSRMTYLVRQYRRRRRPYEASNGSSLHGLPLRDGHNVLF